MPRISVRYLPWWKRSFSSPLTYRFLAAAGGIVVAALALPAKLPAVAASSVFVAVMLGCAAIADLFESRRRRSVDPLECVLHLLYRVLLQFGGRNANPGLRIAVYVPDGVDRLRQLTNFVEDGKVGNGRGNVMSARAGAVGEAFRRKKEVSMRLGEGQRLEDLLMEWGFTPAEARGYPNQWQAWVAVPIGHPNKDPLAILCCEANDRDFFNNKTTHRRRLISCTATAIADLVTGE